MLNEAENEEARRLEALREAEAKRKAELEEKEAREAQERELAMARLEEERRLRLEEKKKKLQQEEKNALDEDAARNMGDRMRQMMESDRLKEKQRKEAAERAIQQAKEERIAKEIADREEAARVAADKRIKEEVAARRLAEDEAEKLRKELEKAKADASARERQLQQDHIGEMRRIEQQEAKKREFSSNEELDKLRQETDRLNAQLKEEQALREEANRQNVLKQQMDEELNALLNSEKDETVNESLRKAREEVKAEMEKELEMARQETERLAIQLQEAQKIRDEEKEFLQRENDRLMAQLFEEQKLRDESSSSKERGIDPSIITQLEADKARAEAEKAIADAQKAKEDAEKAKAEKENVQAEVALNKKKAAILERAAKIREEEAEEAKRKRLLEERHLDWQKSFEQQRLDLEAEISRAERTALEKKDELKTNRMRAEVEEMRLKLKAVEAMRQEGKFQFDTEYSGENVNSENKSDPEARKNGDGGDGVQNKKITHFSDAVDLKASHAELSLKRLHDRARMSKRSLTAAHGPLDERRNYMKSQSMPDNYEQRFSSFSSGEPSSSLDRHSIGGPAGRILDSRISTLSTHVQRHSIGGGDSSSPWEKVRRNVMEPGGVYRGKSQLEAFANKSLADNGTSPYEGKNKTPEPPTGRKRVSMNVPSPHSNVNSSTPRSSNRFLQKSYTVGYVPSTTGSMLTPPSPGPLKLSAPSPGSVDTDNSDVPLNISTTVPQTLENFSPERASGSDIQLDYNSPISQKNSPQRIGTNEENNVQDNQQNAASRLSAKKKAEADRVRAKRQAEAKNFAKRKSAAEAFAVRNHKKNQADDVAKMLYLEKVVDSATEKKSKVEAEEAARVKEAKAVIASALAENMELQQLKHNNDRHSNIFAVSDSVEEIKTQTDHSEQENMSSRPPMAPKVKSLVLGDFSLRHAPVKNTSSSRNSLLKVGSYRSLKSDNSEEEQKKVLQLSSDSSVGSTEEVVLKSRLDDDFDSNFDGRKQRVSSSSEEVYKNRFSSSSDDNGSPSRKNRFSSGSAGGSSYGENKSSDSLSSPSKRYTSQPMLQNGHHNASNEQTLRSLSSQNKVHNKSASRLGDLVIDQKLTTSAAFFKIDNMNNFHDIFGEWLGNHAKFELHESYPDDHLDQEKNIDNYVNETIRRSAEIEWRLGKLESKLPNPKGIYNIRKLLHAKGKKLKKLRDRKSQKEKMTPKEMNELREDIHAIRNKCLEAVDRERVALKDPEHIIEEEFIQIANL